MTKKNKSGSALAVVASCAVALAACGDAFSGGADVAAHADQHQLEASRLAGWLAGVERLPVRRDVAERAAHRWVEFTLFADRMAAGDSMLDRETVLQAMWPDVYQELVDIYHEELVQERLALDSAALDSAYAAGEHRLIDHILIRTTPTMSPPERTAAQARANAIRGDLMAGGSWEEANEQNEDPGARDRGGSLGVIVRGQTVPDFEAVAYALEPGDISEVAETPFGYHVIRRPPLDEVREQYRVGVEDILIENMDTLFLGELAETWRIRVRDGAPAAMREAAEAPFRALDSERVLGTHRRGNFTVADFVRWMQALPPQMFSQINAASSEQLSELTRALIRNEVLVQEARERGAEIAEESFELYKEQLRQEIQNVRQALRLDSVLGQAGSAEERDRAVEATVEDYLLELMESRRATGVVVPAFLAQWLRTQSRWSVSSPGLDLAVELAQAARQAAMRPAPADTQAPGVSDTSGEGG
jgi:peptidyl-prolyl cis-trans isomerase D